MLINYTYFLNGLCKVPGVTSGNTPTDEGNRAELESLIYIYEPQIMDVVFGKTLYDAMIAGLAVDLPESRWTTLKNKLVNSTAKTSPIANYIAIKYFQLSQQISTRSGDKSIAPQGMVNEGNVVKIVELNNNMVDWFNDFLLWFLKNSDDYPEWDYSYYLWSAKDYSNSLGI